MSTNMSTLIMDEYEYEYIAKSILTCTSTSTYFINIK